MGEILEGLIPDTKKCPQCQRTKPRSEFYPDKRHGITCWCKECQRNKQRNADRPDNWSECARCERPASDVTFPRTKATGRRSRW